VGYQPHSDRGQLSRTLAKVTRRKWITAVDIIHGRDFQFVIKDFGYRDNGADERAQEILLVFGQAIEQCIGDL
jgi:hypothetical protein